MSLTAFLLIFASVFLHAGWNFLCKSHRPSTAFYLISSMTSAVIWFPAIFLVKVDFSILPAGFWAIFGASIFFEVVYFYGLAHSYRTGDISAVYPVVRALPVLLTAVVTMILGIGTRPGATALLGMGIVTAGCLLIPRKTFSGFRFSDYRSRAMLYILIAACGTTGYTILDSSAMRELCSSSSETKFACSMVYTAMLELGITLGTAVIVFTSRRETVAFRSLFLKSFYPNLSGAFSSSAYLLVLLAMGYVTNVSYIQAFRQMSLPIGVLLGIFVLKEAHGPVKLTGIALVVIGLVVTAL